MAQNAASLFQQLLDRVRNFQFSARRRPNAVDRLMDFAREKVDPDQSQIRSGFPRLFDKAKHLSLATNFGNPKAGWVAYFLEQDGGVGIRFLKAVTESPDSRSDQIVTEIHNEGTRFQKSARNLDRMRQP